MTKEHAWPRWAGKNVEVEPFQHTYTTGFERTGDDTLAELPNRAVHKKGSVLTAVVREVCSTCNNGWMSQLEFRIAPLIGRLRQQHYPLGMTCFTASEHRDLIAWAIKSAWVRERLADHDNVAEAADREAFSRTLMPPAWTFVWAARHAGASNFRALTASIGISHQDQHWATGERRRVRLCALRFQQLAFLVRTDSGSGVPPMALPAEVWTALHPGEGGFVWPPRHSVGDLEVEAAIQNVGSWLQLPATTTFERSGGWEHVRRN